MPLPNDPVAILLVDDRPENLLTLETVLKHPQYQLVTALSGPQALARLAEREYALILLDVQMPGMDGFETARQIKQYPAYQAIPIIFITAINREAVHVFRGYESGAIDYVLKPFDDDILRAKVAVIVELFQKTAQLKREIEERQRLEQDLVAISEREQQRIGEDLHDGLCQQLTGVALMCMALARQLTAKAPAEAAQILQIGDTIKHAIGTTRDLIKGLLYPTVLAEGDFTAALSELASSVEALTSVSCQVEARAPIGLPDHAMALHLYRIVQEAIANALKHGNATHVRIRVEGEANDEGGGLRLAITDNGMGSADYGQQSPNGMGLRIMRHRAHMIGGSLQVRREPHGGTTVICRLPQLTPAERVPIAPPVPPVPAAALS